MKLNQFLVMSHFHLSSEEQLPRYQKIRNLIINLTSHKPPDAKTSSHQSKNCKRNKIKTGLRASKNFSSIFKQSQKPVKVVKIFMKIQLFGCAAIETQLNTFLQLDFQSVAICGVAINLIYMNDKIFEQKKLFFVLSRANCSQIHNKKDFNTLLEFSE